MIPNTSQHQPEKDVQERLEILSLADTPTTTSTEVLSANTGSSIDTGEKQSLLQESSHYCADDPFTLPQSVHNAHKSIISKDPTNRTAKSEVEHERTGLNNPDPNTSVTPISSQRFGHRGGTKGSRWDFGGENVAEPGDFAFGGHSYTGYESTFVNCVLRETPTEGTDFALQPPYQFNRSLKESIALGDCTASEYQRDGSGAHTARGEAPDLWTPYEPNPLPKYEPLQDVPVARVQQCLDTLRSAWGLHKSSERMDALQEIYAKCRDDMVLIHVKLYIYSKTLPQSSARETVPPEAQALVKRIKAIWENMDQALQVCLYPYSDWWTTKQRKNRIENLEEALKSARLELSEIFREAGKLLAESQGQGV